MDIYAKLDPQRFPNMSLPMATILGYVLERQYTTPALADVQVTPDGHVLGWPSEEEGADHSMHLGIEADLRVNLSRLGMAAGFDQEEWAQFAAMVRSRLGIELGELAGEGCSASPVLAIRTSTSAPRRASSVSTGTCMRP